MVDIGRDEPPARQGAKRRRRAEVIDIHHDFKGIVFGLPRVVENLCMKLARDVEVILPLFRPRDDEAAAFKPDDPGIVDLWLGRAEVRRWTPPCTT